MVNKERSVKEWSVNYQDAVWKFVLNWIMQMPSEHVKAWDRAGLIQYFMNSMMSKQMWIYPSWVNISIFDRFLFKSPACLTIIYTENLKAMPCLFSLIEFKYLREVHVCELQRLLIYFIWNFMTHNMQNVILRLG